MRKEKEGNGPLESALRRLYIGFRRNGKQNGNYYNGLLYIGITIRIHMDGGISKPCTTSLKLAALAPTRLSKACFS